MTEEINAPPEIDNKLRHVVPPAVRALQDELKNILQQIIQTEFTKVAQTDEQMTGFLKQFGLPEALHSATSSNDVPDDVWAKIQEFQKKGSANQFKQAIDAATNIKQVNNDLINSCR